MDEKTKNLNIDICGPTVYADAHLGHAWTYVAADTIRRIRQHEGSNVNFVMNI